MAQRALADLGQQREAGQAGDRTGIRAAVHGVVQQVPNVNRQQPEHDARETDRRGHRPRIRPGRLGLRHGRGDLMRLGRFGSRFLRGVLYLKQHGLQLRADGVGVALSGVQVNLRLGREVGLLLRRPQIGFKCRHAVQRRPSFSPDRGHDARDLGAQALACGVRLPAQPQCLRVIDAQAFLPCLRLRRQLVLLRAQALHRRGDGCLRSGAGPSARCVQTSLGVRQFPARLRQHFR